MKTNEKVKKRCPETESNPSRLPKNFICIDPAERPVVFDFLKDSTQDQTLKDAALIHLRLCLHCREAAATVLKIKKYLEPKSDYLHVAQSEVAVEAEEISCMEEEDGETEFA
jgi:hypothetical protein